MCTSMCGVQARVCARVPPLVMLPPPPPTHADHSHPTPTPQACEAPAKRPTPAGHHVCGAGVQGGPPPARASPHRQRPPARIRASRSHGGLARAAAPLHARRPWGTRGPGHAHGPAPRLHRQCTRGSRRARRARRARGSRRARPSGAPWGRGSAPRARRPHWVRGLRKQLCGCVGTCAHVV